MICGKTTLVEGPILTAGGEVQSADVRSVSAFNELAANWFIVRERCRFRERTTTEPQVRHRRLWNDLDR